MTDRIPMNFRSDSDILVDGAWIGSASSELLDVINPATGSVTGAAGRGDPADVDLAVAAALRASMTWRRSTPQERAAALLALADGLESRASEFAEAESVNVGKPLTMAVDEVALCVDNLRFFAGAGRTIEAPAAAEYIPGYTSMLRREPVGVVGQITPWNYPLMMAVWKLGPAIATGNTCVLKPAEETPVTTLMFAELCREVLPAGVVNVITGDGAVVGARLVAHPDVDMISLTGGVQTGRLVAAAAAPTLKRVHLELGGKAPVIIYPDADLDEVATAIRRAGYWNTGQECGAACRVLAPARIYDSLVERVVAQTKQIAVGDPAGGRDVEMGPMISAGQRQRVQGFVDRALAGGRVELLTGGEALDGPGYFMAPTVITGVDQSDEISQLEVFGPVVTIQRVEDAADAVRLANDVPYGLAASVWTTDLNHALRSSQDLRFGTVWINDHLPLASEMPWTGFRGSGYGSDCSIYALQDYLQNKHVMAKIS